MLHRLLGILVLIAMPVSPAIAEQRVWEGTDCRKMVHKKMAASGADAEKEDSEEYKRLFAECKEKGKERAELRKRQRAEGRMARGRGKH